MPVRIYDISKKLGLENKEVLAKAKELGIVAAKVPSSSLDKITAEYLENELSGGRPAASGVPSVPVEPAKIILVTPPIVPPPPPPEPVVQAPEPVAAEAEPVSPVPEPIENNPLVTAQIEAHVPIAPVAPPPAQPTPPPVQPPGPQVGDKVGFIKLPTRPVAGGRPGDKPVAKPAPPRTSAHQPVRQDFGGRGDNRNFRGGIPPTQGRPQAPGNRYGDAGRGVPARPAAPVAPKFVAPETGEVITI